MATLIPMSAIRSRNKARGHFWFEPSTLRFFKSRVGQYGYGAADGRVYFASSECGPTRVRRYSVRVQELDGSIETVGEFQAYASLSGAVRAAQRMAEGGAA